MLSSCVPSCCRYETLIALLESNELGTVSEFNVFLATMRWVDADKNREQFLDEILSLIRFPTMDYEELGLVGKQPTAAGAAVLKVGHSFSGNNAKAMYQCINLVYSLVWGQDVTPRTS